MELIQTLKATISGDDDRGVSPVIGVILMVAITVILAAVIATFVLGLGEQVSSTAPQVTVEWNESGSGTNFDVGATHNGGSTVEGANIDLVSSNSSAVIQSQPADASEMGAGDLIGVAIDQQSGETIRVKWTSDGGDTTATLSEYTVEG
jgi:flagellin-like protein